MTMLMVIVEFAIIIILSISIIGIVQLCRKVQDTSSELRLDNISLTWENERLKERIEWLEKQISK